MYLLDIDYMLFDILCYLVDFIYIFLYKVFLIILKV